MVIQDNYIPDRLKTGSFLNNRVGFFGTVWDIHPETHRVDVLMDIGRLALDLPVASKTWVKEESANKDKLPSGDCGLPPKGSFVFCLMPTHTISGAFVLCSAYPYGDDFTKQFFGDKNDDDFINIEKQTELSGWTTEKRRDNGDVVIKDPKDEISVSIVHDKNDENKDKVEVKVWGTSLSLERGDSGISLTLGSNNSKTPITLNVTGDVNVDTKGNVKINASQKLTIGNSSNTVGKFLGDFIDKVSAMQTYGSPALHNVMPSTQAQLTALKTQINQVFG